MEHPPQPPQAIVPKPITRTRSRIYLVLFALAVLASVVVFQNNAREMTGEMEARAIKGDFPHKQLVVGPATVEDNGMVKSKLSPPGIMWYVASMRLVPPGEYNAVILAHDGVAAHRKKSELIIAARTPDGRWRPASASELLKSLSAASHAPAQSPATAP